MSNYIQHTQFDLPRQTNYYKGKVREVYTIDNDILVMIASDRISAFDVVLPSPIPYKGQVLNQTAAYFLHATRDIVPNWLIDTPDENVAIGYKCAPLKIEMVVRGYLAGHAWRTYKSGLRNLCGVTLPNGLKESDMLPQPIITPTTKSSHGHDEDISREEIIAQKIVAEDVYNKLEQYALQLFAEGTRMAAMHGLILVDTKYEFGIRNGNVMLMDEIHTPDSSRYFYSEGYQWRQQQGEPQKQLSKEFVRQWLLENNFSGKEGQAVPIMAPQFIEHTSARYIELYEKITGLAFVPRNYTNVLTQIEQRITTALAKL